MDSAQEVSVFEIQGVTVVKFGVGELGDKNAMRLSKYWLAAPSDRPLVLLLGSISIDSTGLRVLVEEHQRREGMLRLANPSGLVMRVLEITGLDHVFDIYPTLQEAILGRASEN